MHTKTMPAALAALLIFASPSPGFAESTKAISETDDQQRLFREPIAVENISALSADEMKRTEGAVNPILVGAAISAAVGGGGYMLGVNQGKYPYSTRGLVGNVATGAIIGGATGGLGAAAGGGFSAGANIWRANDAIGNFSANRVWRHSPNCPLHNPKC